MTYEIRFVPEIERDLVDGYTWYESKYPGLGEEFLRIFYTNSNEILNAPVRFPKVYGEFRRRIMKRFPYVIYFRITDNQIIVFGVFHSARDPRGIKLRLTKRQ